MFGLFSRWNARKQRDKWLINEFPRLALAQFETLRDLGDSDRPKEDIYKTMIGGFAITFGVPTEKHDEYINHILGIASLTGRLCLRMVVVSLIGSTWSLKSELAIAVAMSAVEDIIPEHY